MVFTPPKFGDPKLIQPKPVDRLGDARKALDGGINPPAPAAGGLTPVPQNPGAGLKPIDNAAGLRAEQDKRKRDAAAAQQQSELHQWDLNRDGTIDAREREMQAASSNPNGAGGSTSLWGDIPGLNSGGGGGGSSGGGSSGGGGGGSDANVDPTSGPDLSDNMTEEQRMAETMKYLEEQLGQNTTAGAERNVKQQMEGDLFQQLRGERGAMGRAGMGASGAMAGLDSSARTKSALGTSQQINDIRTKDQQQKIDNFLKTVGVNIDWTNAKNSEMLAQAELNAADGDKDNDGIPDSEDPQDNSPGAAGGGHDSASKPGEKLAGANGDLARTSVDESIPTTAADWTQGGAAVWDTYLGSDAGFDYYSAGAGDMSGHSAGDTFKVKRSAA